MTDPARIDANVNGRTIGNHRLAAKIKIPNAPLTDNAPAIQNDAPMISLRRKPVELARIAELIPTIEICVRASSPANQRSHKFVVLVTLLRRGLPGDRESER